MPEALNWKKYPTNGDPNDVHGNPAFYKGPHTIAGIAAWVESLADWCKTPPLDLTIGNTLFRCIGLISECVKRGVPWEAGAEADACVRDVVDLITGIAVHGNSVAFDMRLAMLQNQLGILGHFSPKVTTSYKSKENRA